MLLTASAFDSMLYSLFLGMVLIAAGTGGIKPCVSSLGADQLVVVGMQNRIGTYFTAFYFSINVGAISSFIIIPAVSERLGYHYAFLICAIVLVISIIVIWIPRNQYYQPPLQGSVFTQI
eukprot:TRINITY_DN8074_c0_g1_i1.p1 TRINITY_DN8074_c0_g1~~TRINITY_DN8074_c0_g1_i1.p1  ORF type:complete len:120 (+),score=14.23 TRINITY_DN8074_c0_g1_i1:263-622(+)